MLLPLVALFGGLAAWLLRRRLGATGSASEMSQETLAEPVAPKRGDDSLMYGLVTAATAAASLGLVLWFGFARPGDPSNITWTLAIYSVIALAAGLLIERPDVARVGSALLFAALSRESFTATAPPGNWRSHGSSRCCLTQRSWPLAALRWPPM